MRPERPAYRAWLVHVSCGAALACFFASLPALAVEKQHHLALAPGLTLWNTVDSPVAAGASLGAFYSYGLSDQFNLLAEVRGSLLTYSEAVLDAEKNPIVPKTRPGREGSAAIGAAYALDVLRWVPYAGVLIGAETLGGGTLDKARIFPTAQLAVGLDYQVDRTLTFGLAFRQSFMVLDMKTYPSTTSLFAKVEISWGY
jgi:hypothetical protein